MPETTDKKQDHRFKPGQSGNLAGRPKGSRDFVGELITAMRTVEKKKRKSIFVHAWEEAYDNPKLLAALLKKVVPDLTHELGETQRPIVVQIVQYGETPLAVRVNGH